MKNFIFLRALAIWVSVFFIVLIVPGFTKIIAQDCSNFKINLESRSVILGKTIFVWSIANQKPGNGLNGTSKDLQRWSLGLNSCVKSQDVISCGFSRSKNNWKYVTPAFANAAVASCITTPAINFDYGTHGKATSYYLLIVRGTYETDTSVACLKYGAKYCAKNIAGIGCNCAAMGAPTVRNAERCGPGTVSLKAVGCSDGTLNWYAASSGGAAFASGTTYKTQVVETTSYYVSCSRGGCEGPRAKVTALINPIPDPPVALGGSRCGTGSLTLSASGCPGGVLQWYSPFSDSVAIAQGSSYSPFLFYRSFPLYNTNHQSYFVTCTVNNCVSQKSEAVAEVQFPGLVPATVSDASRCGAGFITLTANCPNGASPGWHIGLGTPPVGFGPSYTTYIENTTMFYVSCPGCNSTSGRVAISAVVNDCDPSGQRSVNSKAKLYENNKTALSVTVSPNPYVSDIRFVITSPLSAKATLDLYNMTGQKVKTVYQGQVAAGNPQTVDFTVPDILRSNLIYRLTIGQEVRTGHLIYAR